MLQSLILKSYFAGYFFKFYLNQIFALYSTELNQLHDRMCLLFLNPAFMGCFVTGSVIVSDGPGSLQ